MNHGATPLSRLARRTTILMSVVFFFVAFSGEAAAQKKFSKNYPAGQNVRLNLMNKVGTVTVEGWNRNEINITAYMEAPAAAILPRNLSGVIEVNLVRDNQGKETGSVNFLVRVPYSSEVDIETRIGNLNVTNIRSGLVRAHISSEGGITLTNIESAAVAADNVMGDIFFDGVIIDGGAYRFASAKGNINLRIPFNSSFKLVATAPSTRNISLGSFGSENMNFLSDGRRVVGRYGGGSPATLTVTNQRGPIQFLPR